MADSYTSIWCTCTENSTNVANNTSNVTVSLVCSTSGYADDNPNYWLQVNGTTVRSGTRNFSSGQTFTLATWTGDITHNSDGTGSLTYQGYFQGTAKPNPGNTTQLYTKTLTTLARESKFGSVSDFNFESSFSFPVTKNIADATDTLVISSGTFSKTISPYVSNQSITLTSTEKTQLYNLNTTGTTVPLTLTLTTVYNSSTIGSDTKTVNGTFVAEAPTASGTINTSPSTIYEGVTTLRVRLNSITFSLKKSATVVQYSVTVDGRTVTNTSASSSTYYDFPNLTSGSKTITVQVLDSRGMSLATPLTKSITVTAYNRPTITNFSISRSPTPVSTDAKVSISGTYADGVVNESVIYVQILYKLKGTSTWNSFNDGDDIYPGYGSMTIDAYEPDEYTCANGQFTLTCDSSVYPDYYERPYPMTSAYDFMLCVWDTVIGSTNYISATASLGTASTTLDIDTNTQRVGVGLFCSTEDDQSLSVAGDIYEGGTKLGNKYAGYEVVSSSSTSGVALAGISVTTTGDANIGGDIYEGGTKLLDKYGNFYKSGDTETVVSTTSGEKYALMLPGLLTTSKTWICFTINTSKNMANVTPSITSLKINPRHSDGGYAIGSSYVSGGFEVVGTSGYTIELHKVNNYCIAVTITHSTYNGTNNTPCIIEVDTLKLSYL